MRLHRGVPMLAAVFTLVGASAPAASGYIRTGVGSPSGQPCTTPDGMPVVGAVAPQCTNHRPSQSVVWSCLCANINGQTNDGVTYCDCPMGTSCVQTISAISGSTPLTGAYCLPSAQASADRGCASECEPGTHPCD